MDRRVLIMCNFIWILSIYCSVKSVLNADVSFQESSIPVHIIENSIHRRSVPSTNDLNLKFQISHQPVTLHFRQNAQVSSQIPVYVIAQNGSVIPEHLARSSENTFYYYDQDYGASFYIQTVNGSRIHMYGTFQFENDEYILEYRKNSTQPDNATSRRPSSTLMFSLKKIPSGSQPRQNVSSFVTGQDSRKSIHSHRTRRSPSYNVEVLFVVDYSVYKHWYDKSSESTQQRKDADAVNSIRQFYAFVVSGIDGRYRSISSSFMAIAFAGLVISKTAGDSPWTEDKKTFKPSDSVYYVDAHQSLNDFSNWAKKQTNLPDHDHAMLLTRYSLSSASSNSLEGYAYVGAMCSPDSHSVMEESDDYVMMTVAAHELGHSLGAGHDGVGNSCKKDDFYIMAATSFSKLGNANPWRFSSCSVQAFQNLIQKLNSERRNCLTSFGSSYDPNALSRYLAKLPGQLYSADEQCATYHGAGSSLCREHYNGNFRPMCGLMWCRDIRNNGCKSMVPADGTLCANKHWCRSGVCSYSSQAASLPDNCVHGDYVGIMDQGMTCAQIVAKDKTECYRERIAKPCCGSCAKVSSGVTGCLYGDRIPSSLCNKTACPYYTKDELSKCCHSCSAYFIVPTTNTMPTESDGTNEILIGISVAIVLVAIGLGIWIHRRRQTPSKRQGKAMKVKTVQNSHAKPSLPPPRKPLSMHSNTKPDYNSNATKDLISTPTLKSHTNKNLALAKDRTSDDKGTRTVNGDLKTKPKFKPPSALNTGPEKSNGKVNGLKSNHENPGKCINNRNPILKKDTSSSGTKTVEATGLLKPASKPLDSKDIDSTTSIKDRISALQKKEPISQSSNSSTSRSKQPLNTQGPKVALKPPGLKPVSAKPGLSDKQPHSAKPKSVINPPKSTSGETKSEAKLPNYRPITFKGKSETETKPKSPTSPKPTQGKAGSTKDTTQPPQYRPMHYGKPTNNNRNVNV